MFFLFFLLVVRCVAYRLNNSKWPQVYYIDAKNLWVCLANGFAQIGYPVERLHFSLRNIKDPSGELLRIRIHRRDLFEVKRQIEDSQIIKDIAKRVDDYQKIYLTKGMVDYPITDANSASRSLFLIGVVEWHKRAYSISKTSFVMKMRPWSEIYRDYAIKRNIELIFYRKIIGANKKDRFSNIFNWFPSVYSFARAIKNIKHIEFFRTKIDVDPKIFIEGRGEVNFNNDGKHSDFYWMEPGNISPKSLVYVPVNHLENIKLIDNFVTPAKYFISQIFPLRVLNKNFYINFYKNFWSLEGRLIHRMLRTYAGTFWYWRGMFLSNNVKVFLTWYRYENQHISIASAIKNVGGVSVYLPVAFDGWGNIEGLTRSDVTFCYSAFGSSIEDVCLSYSQYRIIVGYPRDYAVNLLKPLAADLRIKLTERGAKKIIFVIDENSADDDRWHTGHELQRENYSYALEALLENDWLGVIFKPKVARTLYERLGPISKLLDKALSTGRCYVYDQTSRDVTTAPPLLAGLSADLCIHGHLSSGTAALECALAGLPTLLIDREGVPNSKLSELPLGKVVFRDWKTAIDAALKFLESPTKDYEFGMWGKILDELDPYRDGMASMRIGMYLNYLIQGFNDGFSRDQVLEIAAKKFGDQWGKDKVIKFLGSSHA